MREKKKHLPLELQYGTLVPFRESPVCFCLVILWRHHVFFGLGRLARKGERFFRMPGGILSSLEEAQQLTLLQK